MARDRNRVPAQQVRRGDKIRVRGRSQDVKAVRTRAFSGGSFVILVLKSARAARRRSDEKIPVDQPGPNQRRARRSWFR